MWLTDLRLVLPDRVLERGALNIRDGQIAAVIEGDAPEPGLNGAGLIALPGLIDLHGDMLERDIEPRPGARFPIDLALFELDKRLAASGITTAYAAVSFSWTASDLRSQQTAQTIIETINAHRHHLHVDTRVHARFEVTNPNTGPILAEMLERGWVHLVSVMDHTPGQGQYKNVEKYVDFITRWMGFDPFALGDDLLDRLKNSMVVQAAKPRDWSIVAEVARIASERGIPIASHDDDTAAKVAQQAELGVTISEFPVSLEAAQAAQARGLRVIMGAPNAYRGESNTGNLSAMDAIRAGVVDILATDYFPAAMLHAAFRVAQRGIMPLHEAIKLVSLNPADAIGLTDRGALEVGRRADLVLVEGDPAASDHPRVRATLREGQFIFQDAMIARLTSAHLAPGELTHEN
jgi:alpha-D-ribose 1-methylphosphonate 5-triphosphate diphosphatase